MVMFFFPGPFPMQDHRIKLTKGDVPCPLCQKIFMARRSLLRHLRNVHKRQDYRDIVPSSRAGKEVDRPRNKRGRFVRPGEETGDEEEYSDDESSSQGDEAETAAATAPGKSPEVEPSTGSVGGLASAVDNSSASAPAKTKMPSGKSSTATKPKRKPQTAPVLSRATQGAHVGVQVPGMGMLGMTGWDGMQMVSPQQMMQGFPSYSPSVPGINQNVMQPVVLGYPILVQMQGAPGTQGQTQVSAQIPLQMSTHAMHMSGQMQMGGQLPMQISGQMQMGGQLPMQMAVQMPMQMSGQMPIQITPQMAQQISQQMQHQGAAQVQAMHSSHMQFAGGQLPQLRQMGGVSSPAQQGGVVIMRSPFPNQPPAAPQRNQSSSSGARSHATSTQNNSSSASGQ